MDGVEQRRQRRQKQLASCSDDLGDLLVAFVDHILFFFLRIIKQIKITIFARIQININGINKAKKTIPAKDSAPVLP